MDTEKSYMIASQEIADLIDMESVSSLTHFHGINFLGRDAVLLKAYVDKNEERFLLVNCETSDLIEKLIKADTFVVAYDKMKFKARVAEVNSEIVKLKITEVIDGR